MLLKMYLRHYCCMFLFLAILEEALQENPLIDENLFEGDIIGIDSDTILQLISQNNYDISHEDNTHFAADDGQIGHGAPTRRRHNHELWPDGKVYYEISEEFSFNEINFIQSAFNDFHRYTCIKLIERTDQTDYIKIERYGGCNSWIGKKGGEQYLHLEDYCLVDTTTAKGIAIHEIMHAIGFYHEQSRTDRDDYVEIFLDNVEDIKMKDNFMKYGLGKLQDLHTEYDYESIMHYGKTYFASPGKETIKPKKPGVRIGQREGLSQIDIQEINLLYKCNIADPTTVTVVASKSIQWGKRLTKKSYSRHNTRNYLACRKLCELACRCHAMSYDRRVKSARKVNCYFFHSSDQFTPEVAEIHWGTWIKPTASSSTNSTTVATCDVTSSSKSCIGKCSDEQEPTSPQYSCQEQAQWGKCNEPWMKGYCCKSCNPDTCGRSSSERSCTGKCYDEQEPTSPQYSCQEQAQWGKCNEPWMKGYCCKSCNPDTCGRSSSERSCTGKCYDEQPPTSSQYSCQQQAQWGKCNEPWMKGYCCRSCNWFRACLA